jgi:MFS family permease
VAVLTLLFGLSLVDRLVLSMLVGPIKSSLDLTDVQVGVLMGGAFAVTYVMFGVPIGIIADRFSRKLIVCLALLTWSLATIASGFAQTFAELLACRMIVGVGEAAMTPCAFSIISDMFPPNRRGLPLSIYQMGAQLGSIFSILAGGLLIDWATARGPISAFNLTFRPWQQVLITVGAPGFILCLLPLGMRAPQRSKSPDLRHAGLQARSFVLANRNLLILIFVAFGLAMILTAALTAWLPEFLIRTFRMSHGAVGKQLSLAHLCSPIGLLITGLLSDRLSRRAYKDSPLRVFSWMALISLPIVFGAFFTGSAAVSIVCIALTYLFFFPFMGLASNALQGIVPPELRGAAAGVFMSFVNLLGMGVGPLLIGFLTVYAFKDDAKLGEALGIISLPIIAGVWVLTSMARKRFGVAVGINAERLALGTVQSSV